MQNSEVFTLRSYNFRRWQTITQSLWNITKILDWCNWRENKTKYYHKRDSNKQPLMVPLYVRYSNEGINVRENWRDNQTLTIQKHWQHGVHKTQNEDKQNKKLNTENFKNEQQGPRHIPEVLANGKQLLLLLRHPLEEVNFVLLICKFPCDSLLLRCTFEFIFHDILFIVKSDSSMT